MSLDISYRPFGTLFLIPLRNGLNRPTSVRGKGIKMVNMGELFANNRIGDLPMEKVQVSDDEAKKYLLEPGDLLFARQSLVREGAGKCSIFLGASEATTYEGHIIRTRIDKKIASPEFYYYYFNSSDGRENIESIIEQVSAAGIRGSDLARLEVPYLYIAEQKKIASILGAFDDKIELNRRVNKSISSLTQAVFLKWFVEDKQVESWAIGRLDSLLVLQRGFDITKKDQVAGTVPVVSSSGISSYHDVAKVKAPGIVIGRKGSLGTVHYLDVDFWPHDTTLWVKEYKLAKPAYAYYLIQTLDFEAFDTGSVVPTLNRNHVHSLPVSIAPPELIEKFENFAGPLLNKIHANDRESLTLMKLRDALSLKLMSGELRVKQANKVIENM